MSVLRSVISASLIVSPFILLVLLTAPLADKRYTSGGRCRIWLVLVSALFAPLFTILPGPVFQIDMPVPVIAEPAPAVMDLITPVLTPMDNTVPSKQANPAPMIPPVQFGEQSATLADQPARPNTPESLSQTKPAEAVVGMSFAAIMNALRAHLHIILLGLWLLGAIVSLLLRLVSYLLFVRSVNRWGNAVTNKHALALFENACIDLGVRRIPDLKVYRKITSPMLMGYLKPLVLLPAADYAPDELSLLLRHELAHHKRHDLWFKLALVAVTSVYWFHPLVHLMAAQASKDLEAACDTLTVNGMNMPLRKRYSEIILSAAYKAQLRPHPMTTHFFGGKYMLKKRFSNILGAAKKKGTALFAVAGAIILSITFMVGFNFAEAEAAADAPDALDAYVKDYADQARKYADEYAKRAEELFAEFDWEAYAKEHATDWDAYVKEQTADWEAYAKEHVADWEAYAKEHAADWAEYAEQYDWDAYAKEMEEYAIEMEAYAKEMEENYQSWAADFETFNAQMQEGFDTFNGDFYENGTMHSLDELSELVYDQAKPMERRFENVSSLKLLNLVNENVKVTRGGNALIIRYPEWYEGEYAFTSEDDGKTVLLKKETGNRYLKKGSSINGGWLQEVLRHKGIQTEIVIEVVIPESMPLDSLYIGSVNGKVDITDCTLEKLSLSSVSSPVTVKGRRIQTINISDVDCGIKLENCAFDTLNVSAVSGEVDVQLTGKASDYDITFNNLSGSLKVNGTEVKSARNESAKKKITFSGVSGSLSVNDAK